MPPKQLSLSNLEPAQEREDRKRVGRGPGSGKGRYAGRGIKGQKSRAGSHKMRAGFEGGQMPIYMRIGKQRGPTSKDAMPVGPFRTSTVPVNIRDLERFEAGGEVTPETLVEKRVIKNTKTDVKLLGVGDISKKLTVRVHAISGTAREKIEAAGGTVELLREAKEHKKRHHKAAVAASDVDGSDLVEDQVQVGSGNGFRLPFGGSAHHDPLAAAGLTGVGPRVVGKRQFLAPQFFPSFGQVAVPASFGGIEGDHVVLRHDHQRLLLKQLGIVVHETPQEERAGAIRITRGASHSCARLVLADLHPGVCRQSLAGERQGAGHRKQQEEVSDFSHGLFLHYLAAKYCACARR